MEYHEQTTPYNIYCVSKRWNEQCKQEPVSCKYHWNGQKGFNLNVSVFIQRFLKLMRLYVLKYVGGYFDDGHSLVQTLDDVSLKEECVLQDVP